MRFEVRIDYPKEKMQQSLRRMQARAEFEYVDRVPVNFCVEPRFLAPHVGIRYGDLFIDAETQYVALLKMYAWQIENLPSDACCSPTLVVYPYFDNVKQASAFGCEVVYSPDETLQSVPCMRDISDIETMYLPKPTDGLFGKYIDWWFQMQEFAKETKIYFGKEEGRVVVSPMTLIGLSPHMVAVDLAGTELYYWMGEEPEMYHKLMQKITQNSIECEEYVRKLSPYPWQGFGLAEDTSTIVSAEMYRRMIMPYTLQIYQRFAAGRFCRGMHMCGPSTHLLPVLADNVRITDFNVFGFPVTPQDAAEILGGKTLLWGNINPMLMRSGTKQEVKQACLNALREMAPCGGFMLGDGANIAPGTPLENIAAFVEASSEYGKPNVAEKYKKRTPNWKLQPLLADMS